MAEKKNIYETITAVMDDVGAIGKDDLNKQQGFRYRGIDAVMNALSPSFVKHHLFIVPEVLEQRREERQTAKGGNLIYSICRVKYTFYAEDGSSIEAVVIGEGMDSGDKASNKALAVAFKYVCFQVFCIPTEEMKDPDAESHEVASVRYATEKMRQTFVKECDRIGKPKASILNAIGASSLMEMTVEQYRVAMDNFRKTPSKSGGKADPATIPPDDTEEGLPWNTPAR